MPKLPSGGQNLLPDIHQIGAIDLASTSMSAMNKLLDFCAALDRRKAHYALSVVRPQAIMVSLTIPGEHWEIEFFSDEHVEIERFVSQGVEENASALEDALLRFDS